MRTRTPDIGRGVAGEVWRSEITAPAGTYPGTVQPCHTGLEPPPWRACTL